MASCVMKQLREKHVSSEIRKCSWSNRMDLLAIANVQGQVTLHRLSWQQVWILNPPSDTAKVTALAWRTDGKVLAVGYSTGRVSLVHIEDSSIIHQLEFKVEITALAWNKFNDAKLKTHVIEEIPDPWASYMYSLPPVSKTFTEIGCQTPSDIWQEPRLLQDQSDLTVLTIGTEGSLIHMLAFGLFHIATLKIFEDLDPQSSILHIAPSCSLDKFSIFIEKKNNCEKVIGHVLLDTTLLSLRHKELHSLAQKYGQIHSLMTYIKHTLTLMEEAWESTLIEMDAKLAEYAATVPEGGVSADFLDLLVFGHTSAEFEIFLTNKLTEKYLKKLRHSVDMCYSTMQRLVVRHLQQVGVTLIFLLSQLEGMSKREDLYATLGVDEKQVQAAMAQAGSFLLKAAEMLQAIESSMKDFHIFVRWVSGIHLRLQHEQAPQDLSRMSQQEMASLLSFLNDSFEEIEVGVDGERRTRFRLERAGQYLKEENLKMPPNTEDVPFTKLLSSHPELAAHRLIFKHRPDTSLIQEHVALFVLLTSMGSQPSFQIETDIRIGDFLPLSIIDQGMQSAITQTSSMENSIISVLIPTLRQPIMYILEWPLENDSEYINVSPFFFSGGDGSPLPSSHMCLLDAHFYSPDILSFLLHDPSEPRTSSFAQVSLEILRHQLQPWSRNEGVLLSDAKFTPINVTSIPDASALRRLETGPASMMAVSGPRKVTAVIGDNRRRVRIYEMEAEEDEEEEDEDDTKNESNMSNMNASGASDHAS